MPQSFAAWTWYSSASLIRRSMVLASLRARAIRRHRSARASRRLFSSLMPTNVQPGDRFTGGTKKLQLSGEAPGFWTGAATS